MKHISFIIMLMAMMAFTLACDEDNEEEFEPSSRIIDNKIDNNIDNEEDVSLADKLIKLGWTTEEIDKANTAANLKLLEQTERDIVLYINLARLDGEKFWQTLGEKSARGSDEYVSTLKETLATTKNLQMLIPDANLIAAATAHATDLSVTNTFSHESSDGTSFSARIYKYYSGGGIGETISAGWNDALDIVMQLLVDDGVESLGHRKILLSKEYVAIGVKVETHKQWNYVAVLDFGDKVDKKAN